MEVQIALIIGYSIPIQANVREPTKIAIRVTIPVEEIRVADKDKFRIDEQRDR